MLPVNNISTKTFSGNTVQAFIFYMRGCYIMKKYVKTVQQHELYLFRNKAWMLRWNIFLNKRHFQWIMSFLYWRGVQVHPHVDAVIGKGWIHPQLIRTQQLCINKIKKEIRTLKSDRMIWILSFWNILLISIRIKRRLNTNLDLHMKKLYILNCFVRHCTDVHFLAIRNQLLKNPQPCINPLPPHLLWTWK